MNRVNHTFSSIEQVTDQFLTTKNQKNLEKYGPRVKML